jgi:hypothetical protein
MSLRTRLSVSLSAAALIAGAVLLAGCGAGGKKAAPTPGQPSAEQPSGDAANRTPVRVTGTEPVILVANATLAGDYLELARLTGYSSIACTSGDESAKAPKCRPGEDDGTQVQVVAFLQCQGSWVRPELVTDLFKAALPDPSKVFALYVPKRKAGSFAAPLDAQYVLVLRSGSLGDGSPFGSALHVRDGRVVMVQTPCGQFLQLVNADAVDSYVIDPTLATPSAGN